MTDWLIDAADLLAEPDPGPTPWLVEGLIVDQALTAVVGKWKTTKSYGLLDIGVSIATGTPAFGTARDPRTRPGRLRERGVRQGRTLAPARRALPRPRDPPRTAPRPAAPRRRTRASSSTTPTGRTACSSSASNSGRARSSSTRSPA